MLELPGGKREGAVMVEECLFGVSSGSSVIDSYFLIQTTTDCWLYSEDNLESWKFVLGTIKGLKYHLSTGGVLLILIYNYNI